MILRLVIKIIWILLGSLSFVGGIIGMLLPVIPQVPFFLLTIWCLTRVSPRFNNWLQHNRLYLKYVQPILDKFSRKKVQRKAISENK